jgi:hypothetical protein
MKPPETPVVDAFRTHDPSHLLIRRTMLLTKAEREALNRIFEARPAIVTAYPIVQLSQGITDSKAIDPLAGHA